MGSKKKIGRGRFTMRSAKVIRIKQVIHWLDETEADIVAVNAPVKKPKEMFSFNLLLFVASFTSPRDQRDARIGDIEERYPKNCEKFGVRKAKLLIVRDIIMSIWPEMRGFFQSKMISALKYVGLSHFIKHYFGGG